MIASSVCRSVRARMAAEIRARWDAALLDRSTDFAADVRSLRHLAERYGRSANQDEQRRRLDESQERLRVLSEELRLVGNQRFTRPSAGSTDATYAYALTGIFIRSLGLAVAP